MQSRFKIYILLTGGTIDKTYCESDGSMLNKASLIKSSILEKLRLPHTNLVIESILSKDSLDMTNADRKFMADKVASLQNKGHPIVITHGTDTLTKTYQYFWDTIRDGLQVPVIFTGAMRPLELANTDAWQNLIEALAFARVVESGIYISFHNSLYSDPRVKKDKLLSTFVSK